MDKTKCSRLEAAGWHVGDAADLLELTAEEATFVEIKLALADYLRDIRAWHGWTQTHVARVLGSSQSRVAKLEAADASVSVDLLVKSLLTLGASRKKVGQVLARAAYQGEPSEEAPAERGTPNRKPPGERFDRIMSTTTIEWTETTWNPVTGCSKVSPGCLQVVSTAMRNVWPGGGRCAPRRYPSPHMAGGSPRR
jgi:transcriptional regulator with XRE-family HTH domain